MNKTEREREREREREKKKDKILLVQYSLKYLQCKI
jgi:hypothetical protein